MSCEKCGSHDVLTRWHGQGRFHGSRRHTECYWGEPKGEHLHYTCRNCQYDWTGPLIGSGDSE